MDAGGPLSVGRLRRPAWRKQKFSTTDGAFLLQRWDRFFVESRRGAREINSEVPSLHACIVLNSSTGIHKRTQSQAVL